MEIVLAVLLTALAYLAFPVGYYVVNGKVSEKKAKKMALLNSVICEAIFTIGGFAIGVAPSTNGTMFAQGFLYYFIAKAILGSPTVVDNTNTSNTTNTTSNTEKEKSVICSKCGMQMFSDEEKCSNCGQDNPLFKNKEVQSKNLSATNNTITTKVEEDLEEVDDEEVDEEIEDNEDDEIIEEEIIEEELIDDKLTVSPKPTPKLNSNVSSYTPSNRVNNIGILQKVLTTFVCILLLFAIIYPISMTAAKNGKIPSQRDYKTTQLTRLDASQTVYCTQVQNWNYVYIKNNSGEILVYRFSNNTMYNSSNGVRSGFATTQQIRNYFANTQSGTPSASFVIPAALPVGLSICGVLAISIIVMFYYLHKMAEEEIFVLIKKDKRFIDLKEKHKNEDISDNEYKRLKREYFSNEIMYNNKFFALFKIFY